MATEIEGIYHNGKLEIKQILPLKEGQVVHIMVLTETERIATMNTLADQWLAQQDANALPNVTEYSEEELAKMDAEWDEVLAEIQSHIGDISEEEIAADVEAAVKDVRQQMPRRENGR